MNRLKAVNRAMYVLSAIIFSGTAIVLYLLVSPIQVLSDWRVEAPSGSYHIGDIIVVQSIFTKLKDVHGVSTRTLVCDNLQGSTVSYPINSAAAVSVAKKKTGVGITIVIPEVVTPAKCSVNISIEYKVYPFKTVTEFATSNQFNVVK